MFPESWKLYIFLIVLHTAVCTRVRRARVVPAPIIHPIVYTPPFVPVTGSWITLSSTGYVYLFRSELDPFYFKVGFTAITNCDRLADEIPNKKTARNKGINIFGSWSCEPNPDMDDWEKSIRKYGNNDLLYAGRILYTKRSNPNYYSEWPIDSFPPKSKSNKGMRALIDMHIGGALASNKYSTTIKYDRVFQTTAEAHQSRSARDLYSSIGSGYTEIFSLSSGSTARQKQFKLVQSLLDWGGLSCTNTLLDLKNNCKALKGLVDV